MPFAMQWRKGGSAGDDLWHRPNPYSRNGKRRRMTVPEAIFSGKSPWP
jgi:hypothetical protein